MKSFQAGDFFLPERLILFITVKYKGFFAIILCFDQLTSPPMAKRFYYHTFTIFGSCGFFVAQGNHLLSQTFPLTPQPKPSRIFFAREILDDWMYQGLPICVRFGSLYFFENLNVLTATRAASFDTPHILVNSASS